MGIYAKLKTVWAAYQTFEEIEKEFKQMSEPENQQPDGTTEHKPGWKTTEFWGKVIVQLMSFWAVAKGMLPPEKALLINGVLEGVYTIARSFIKTIPPRDNA